MQVAGVCTRIKILVYTGDTFVATLAMAGRNESGVLRFGGVLFGHVPGGADDSRDVAKRRRQHRDTGLVCRPREDAGSREHTVAQKSQRMARNRRGSRAARIQTGEQVSCVKV